ncbi:hypothetical protein EMIHUDRAFT_231489 [Emiliania huxleyi CCMP1516]|uniref:Uncharacterized protein n=2 Tax=Emiliania huxleyi TaxID=2903 RepID=A0A0D3K7G4_EMIH1|nr:hypothetical protein EMIHUDRAFT_231489 [Emiliania huxleyi CCMP1516]EOD31699.1 hypothetical protein EMIHUDRAFT_231489 [Emiliania huxleyi CCMP1516]|eukprot:XP_005784128.1 hypothetical protein EMIHUDRAFT_231489 [Emiliania huxleyi CCMP1516]
MSPARYVTPDPDDDGYDEDVPADPPPPAADDDAAPDDEPVLPDPSCCPALPLLLLALIGTVAFSFSRQEQRREAAKKWHGRSERAEAEHE